MKTVVEKLKLLSKITGLGLLVIFLNSQSQTGVGILNALENLVTQDSRNIVAAYSATRYQQIVEQHNRDKNRGRLQHQRRNLILNHCPANGTASSPLPNVPALDSLMRSTRDTMCKCVAWGNCSKDICGCQYLCPNNFDIFRRKPMQGHTQSLSTKENSLAFRNEASAFADTNEMTNGYCWGHASMTSKFNRLADWNVNDTSKLRELRSANSSRRQRAINYYKDLIKDISNNKVRTIPGFRNLFEFSSNPTIQRLIASQVADEWGENAMTWSGLFTSLGSGKMSASRSNTVLSRILGKIANNQQPQIVFTQRGSRFATHAVLVSHMKRINGKIHLCIRDNNWSPERNHSCQNRIYIAEDGGMEYQRNGRVKKLGAVTLAHNNEEDTLAQFNSLRYKCLDERKCMD